MMGAVQSSGLLVHKITHNSVAICLQSLSYVVFIVFLSSLP